MNHQALTELPRETAASAQLAERLRRIWEGSPGFYGWLSSVDHKSIGIRYIITAFAFLLLGGLEALAMRLQLAGPNLKIMGPEAYNATFTMHGVTMIFLYAMPILSGFSNYLWPLLLGARDMAFPRLNAISYWIYLFSGLLLYASFLFGHGPDAGWFNYVPYAAKQFNAGINIDVYALGMVLLGVSTTVGALNFIVTLIRMRAPGMSINRMPILVWGTLTASVGNLFAVPAVSLAFFLLWMDRQFGTHFFEITGGGKPLLWQHLFWMFGHPWVYALVLPAMGIVSDALPTFCRRPLVGYTAVALATVTTMVIGFGVWVHHMFATGLPPIALSFFSGASMVIAIPSAVSVFAWIATIWTGRPVLSVPFLFFAGFVVLFVIGGVSGFMTASLPLDWQLTDTYFVVAHLHYVLLGINLFPVIGATYYWFPKMTGRLTDKRLGQLSFWVLFTGFNVTFLPMHLTGLFGMPRRVYTYSPDMGWTTLNMISSSGSVILAVGVLIWLYNMWTSARIGQPAPENPWMAPTLEWSVPSPPPPYNFVVLPTIATRHPLWEDWLEESPARSRLAQGYALDHGRQALGTSPLDATPDVIFSMPGDTLMPLLCALAITGVVIALLFKSWILVAICLAISLLVTLSWLWPSPLEIEASGGTL